MLNSEFTAKKKLAFKYVFVFVMWRAWCVRCVARVVCEMCDVRCVARTMHLSVSHICVCSYVCACARGCGFVRMRECVCAWGVWCMKCACAHSRVRVHVHACVFMFVPISAKNVVDPIYLEHNAVRAIFSKNLVNSSPR